MSVKRGKAIVHEGKLTSLRRVKDTVEEVSEGLECGVFVDGWLEWQPGDEVREGGQRLRAGVWLLAAPQTDSSDRDWHS